MGDAEGITISEVGRDLGLFEAERIKKSYLADAGYHLPKVIKAGVYKGKGRQEFWFTKFKSEAVIFDLEGEEFDRVVVDAENAQEIVDEMSS